MSDSQVTLRQVDPAGERASAQRGARDVAKSSGCDVRDRGGHPCADLDPTYAAGLDAAAAAGVEVLVYACDITPEAVTIARRIEWDRLDGEPRKHEKDERQRPFIVIPESPPSGGTHPGSTSTNRAK